MSQSVMRYAHSAQDELGNLLPYEYWQTLQSHSVNVGEMAAEFARVFGAQEIACQTGQLHDLGKYSEPFDRRLHGGPSVDHATAGAKIAVERWGNVIGKLMAFCIAGHHAGLANGNGEGDNRRTLKQRLALKFGEDIPALDNLWQQEIKLPKTLSAPPLKADAHHPFFSYAFFTRMLYSCLVDADYLDTEAFYLKLENKAAERGGYPDLSALQHNFNQFINDFRRRIAQAPEQTEAEKCNAALNRLRSEILDYAVEQAAQVQGLFTLTVPTGGGKTFTSMAFALEHAKRHGMRRVIYVIPFTSIIEQNAAEFRKAFGELGEQAVIAPRAAASCTTSQAPSSSLMKRKCCRSICCCRSCKPSKNWRKTIIALSSCAPPPSLPCKLKTASIAALKTCAKSRQNRPHFSTNCAVPPCNTSAHKPTPT